MPRFVKHVQFFSSVHKNLTSIDYILVSGNASGAMFIGNRDGDADSIQRNKLCFNYRIQPATTSPPNLQEDK
jgi:hypothetical protein